MFPMAAKPRPIRFGPTGTELIGSASGIEDNTIGQVVDPGDSGHQPHSGQRPVTISDLRATARIRLVCCVSTILRLMRRFLTSIGRFSSLEGSETESERLMTTSRAIHERYEIVDSYSSKGRFLLGSKT